MNRLSIINISINFYEIEWDQKINFQKLGQVNQFSAFLGILNILNENFLVFVEEVEQICIIDEYQIFECKKVQVIHMSYQKLELSKDIKQHIERIEKILSFGHYFAFNYPLSLNLQKHEEIKNIYPNSDLGSHYDIQYLWNNSMLKPLINQGISHLWHLQLIQGYVKNFQCSIDQNIHINYYLISRRSIYRSGTRCNHRGIDTDGNTANFVEHESIYVFNKGEKITAHIQIRGSLPILWEQNGLKGKISLAGGEHLSLQSFKKHFGEITQKYGKIFSVSLMAEGRSGEKLLTNTFKQHYEQAKEFHSLVQYDTFDIKKHCKGGKYENINPYIIKSLYPIQKEHSFLLLNTDHLQNGVVRTNCKSSLDRTNIFQSKVELNQLQIMLKELYGFDFVQNYKQDALDMMENQKQCIQFIKQFKLLWSQNGDNISQHYAGTNALTSHATRTGSGGLFGKIRGKFSSIKRLYEGTFQDSHKQECIDIILGRHMNSQKGLKFEEDLKLEAFKRESQFLQKKQISIYINTWNLKKYLPKNTNAVLKNIFNFKNYKTPDLIVMCFQKKPEYKIENLSQDCQDKTERQFWVQLFQNNMVQMGMTEYVEVDYHISENQMTIIMAQKNLMEDITAVDHDDINSIGKGIVVIKMNICDTRICFINARLSSGLNKLSDRLQQIQDIHSKAFQKEGMSKYKREKIEKLDKIFLTGDLNFRVNLEYYEGQRQIHKMLEFQSQEQKDKLQPILQYYLGYDQLSQNKKGVLLNYLEPPIQFMPTYKYCLGSNKYDFSKEQIPSWCSRILMWNNEQNQIMKIQQNQDIEIEQSFLPFNILLNNQPNQITYREGLPLFYDRQEVEISDHKAVCAYYLVTVRDEDVTKKEKILKDLIHKKINQSAIQVQANDQLKEFWQNDDEDHQGIPQQQQSVQILKVIDNQQFDESQDMEDQEEGDEEEEEEDDDEDEDIQGDYDKQQYTFYIDQTKLNHTTKPKYKYSEDYTDLKDQLAALNFSNNIEVGKLKAQKFKNKVKQGINNLENKSKLQVDPPRLSNHSNNNLVLSKYPSEKQPCKYQSDFKRNKILNESQQQNELNGQDSNQTKAIRVSADSAFLNQSSIHFSIQNNLDAPKTFNKQLSLQKHSSHIPPTSIEQFSLTSNDRIIKNTNLSDQQFQQPKQYQHDFPRINVEAQSIDPQITQQINTQCTLQKECLPAQQQNLNSVITYSNPAQQNITIQQQNKNVNNNNNSQLLNISKDNYYFSNTNDNVKDSSQSSQQKKYKSDAQYEQSNQNNNQKIRKMSEGNSHHINNNNNQLLQQKEQKNVSDNSDVVVVKFDNLVIINDYSNTKNKNN